MLTFISIKNKNNKHYVRLVGNSLPSYKFDFYYENLQKDVYMIYWLAHLENSHGQVLRGFSKKKLFDFRSNFSYSHF